MIDARYHYRAIWCVDFEFGQEGGQTGGRPEPRCVVGKELRSGRVVRLWLDGSPSPDCPFDLDDDSLYVAFYAPAEASCHVALNWPLPKRTIDLFAELKIILNGRVAVMDDYLKKNHIGRSSLVGALYHFGLFEFAIPLSEKEAGRELALRGGPYTDQERRDLLAYNESDVIATEQLFLAMHHRLELAPALFRGRYTTNLGQLEHGGIQLDGPLFRRLKTNWTKIVDRLIEEGVAEFDVLKYREVDRLKLENWLTGHGVTYWPRTPTGHLDTDEKAFTDMAKVYPQVMRLKEYLQGVRQTKL